MGSGGGFRKGTEAVLLLLLRSVAESQTGSLAWGLRATQGFHLKAGGSELQLFRH